MEVYMVDVLPKDYSNPITIGIFSSRDIAVQECEKAILEIMEKENEDADFIISEINSIRECGDSYYGRVYPFIVDKVYAYVQNLCC